MQTQTPDETIVELGGQHALRLGVSPDVLVNVVPGAQTHYNPAKIV